MLVCTGWAKCLVTSRKINTTHNVEYMCFKKLNLLYFRYFHTSLVTKFEKLNFVYLQHFQKFYRLFCNKQLKHVGHKRLKHVGHKRLHFEKKLLQVFGSMNVLKPKNQSDRCGMTSSNDSEKNLYQNKYS